MTPPYPRSYATALAKMSRGAGPDPSTVPPDRLLAAVDAAENKFPPTWDTVDWGPRKRGQGKRIGHMVVGAMSDAPVGERQYADLFGGLPDRDAHKADLDLLLTGDTSKHLALTYLKARSLGLPHGPAFTLALLRDHPDGPTVAHGEWVESSPPSGGALPDRLVFKNRGRSRKDLRDSPGVVAHVTAAYRERFPDSVSDLGAVSAFKQPDGDPEPYHGVGLMHRDRYYVGKGSSIEEATRDVIGQLPAPTDVPAVPVGESEQKRLEGIKADFIDRLRKMTGKTPPHD
jgi:hypothetical protein